MNRLIVIGCVALVALLSMAASGLPTPALAAPPHPGCQWSGCNGLKPEAEGCTQPSDPGARIVAENRFVLPNFGVNTTVAVEYWASPACQAGWVNVRTIDGTSIDMRARVNNGGFRLKYCFPSCTTTIFAQNVHTVMIQTSGSYFLWGQGCALGNTGGVTCDADPRTGGDQEFNGWW